MLNTSNTGAPSSRGGGLTPQMGNNATSGMMASRRAGSISTTSNKNQSTMLEQEMKAMRKIKEK